MATNPPESSQIPVDQSDEEEKVEKQLISYLQTVLKYQIVPMDFRHLRKLVKEAPSSKCNIYKYVKEKYPNEEFLVFLQKYPEIFIVNPDRTVQVSNASYCTQPKVNQQNQSSYDEVDGDNKAEYISDQESEESDMNVSDSE